MVGTARGLMSDLMSDLTRDLMDDVRGAIAFLTRIPMPHPEGSRPADFVRAHRVFPLVGAAIGAAVGLLYVGLLAMGMPKPAAAALALGAGALITGALHEDGLADLADGFGGGRDRAQKLEIMRDSRLGTYGALVLLVAFAAKVSALAALPQDAVLPGLIAAHALARTPMTAMAWLMDPARKDGLSASAGRPDAATVTISLLVAVAIAVLVLPWRDALLSATAVAAGALAVAVLAQRQIGGHTGDVLGASEQVGEIAVLLLLACRHAAG